MIMQRQVPARPAVRQPGTRAENAASEDPFAKVLSGQRQNQDRTNETSRGEAAEDGAEAATAGHETDGEGASGTGSGEMMALLEGLMSSASYSQPAAASADPDAEVGDGAGTAGEEIAAADAGGLADGTGPTPDQDDRIGNGADIETTPMPEDTAVRPEDDVIGKTGDKLAGRPDTTGPAGEKPVPNAGAQPVSQAATGARAATDAQAATAAAAAPQATAAKAVAAGKSPSGGKAAAEFTGSSQPRERGDASASDTRRASTSLGSATEPVPARTEPERATRNERPNAFVEARTSLGASRNEERLEGGSKNVEVLESRRFLGTQPVSGNAQMLTRSLGDASGEIFQAQRSAPAQSASLAGQPQSGQMLHTLKLQLNPASLGSVTAVLKLAGEELTVDIKVHTAEAYRQLSDDNQAILKSLRAQGYGVEQINIQHVPGGPDRSAGQTFQQGQQNGFQGPGSGDAQASGREAGGQGSGRQTGKQGDQGHEQNSYASSDTQRSDGVYL